MAAATKRLGKRIRQLRTEQGMTQDQASEKARLDPKHWSDLERAQSNPTLATLVGIARALSVPVADLFLDE